MLTEGQGRLGGAPARRSMKSAPSCAELEEKSGADWEVREALLFRAMAAPCVALLAVKAQPAPRLAVGDSAPLEEACNRMAPPVPERIRPSPVSIEAEPAAAATLPAKVVELRNIATAP